MSTRAPTPPPSASALRRAQRRRASLGGGNLAADRGELLSQQHDRQRTVDGSAPGPRAPARGVTGRAAIVWLPAPVPIGPGSRCRILGYVEGTVLPGWLAARLEEAEA